ncbi:hypothetical protein Taro_031299 [Colocasia esculenta]|uniref:Uncharacterized protein n=1 Tax=Colocasia esculenta TaxID=4460 RepID=A0A843W2S2_COLES|nr:hypothetical protein [Colocasia esculenta]
MFRVVCMEDLEMVPGLGFSPEKATDPTVATSWVPQVPRRARHVSVLGACLGAVRQLDLTSVTARLRGVGTVVFVFQWRYLVVVGRVLNATAVGVAFWLPLLGSTSACALRVTHGVEFTDVGNGKATP